MAKGLRKPIARSTHTRADKRLQRVFVDLSGPMAVKSIGGKRYTLIVRDDCTRFNRVYFLRHKSDAASAFESFLAEVRADGILSTVMAVRSDNGREFFGGAFGELCRKRCIKQEFTPADSPKYNGVAERALGLINDAAAAARIQATELGAGAAGARKATPRHHRPPSGGEAPAAEFAAAATGVRTATPRHQRFPPGGEAPAAKFAAAATGVRMATPRHQRFPPGGETPAVSPGRGGASGKICSRGHGGAEGNPPASMATVAATAARTAVPAATAAAATTVETFPPTRGDLRGTWRRKLEQEPGG